MKKLFLTVAIVLSYPVLSYGQGPVNLMAKRLPPNYSGHNCAYVCSLLKSRATSKGKYETTKEYRARISREDKKPLFGNVYKWSPLGFAARPNMTTYDADTQTFNAHFFWNDNYDGTHDAVLARYTQASGDYEAQNAFGAGTKVYYDRFQNYGVQVMNSSAARFQDTDKSYLDRLSFISKVPAARAKQLEKTVRILCVGYITSPVLASDMTYSGPTLEGAYSETNYYTYLCFRLKAIWFYDEKTGAILQKISV